MAKVFLSYDREDAAKAKSIAAGLHQAGHVVWWDRHIMGGAQYSKEIESALKAAEAVVVLWSVRSVDSAWVRDEAAAGRDSGRLVPVLIDGTEPPLGFRQYQAAELSGWKGRANARAFQQMLRAIESLSSAPEAAAIESPPKAAMSRPRLGIFLTMLAAGVLTAGIVIWRPWSNNSTSPIVAIAAASQSAQARNLARDLLAKLGNLHATQTDTLKLIQGDDAEDDADLIIEVDGTTQGQTAMANLILLAGGNRALLWSKDFEQPLANNGDLNQQLAYTAAKVIECAAEALASEGARLSQESLKLYLNGCSEMAATDPRMLVPVFRAVVEQAPSFQGAWAKLIHAEVTLATSPDYREDAEKNKQQLFRDMAAARKLKPDMAEILIAEAGLVPPNAFASRMELLKRAVERNPESPEAAAAYGNILAEVGRGYESIERARRAVQLDPLSPSHRDNLITTLAYTGQFDAALEELRKAELLWPGASNLLGARYRIHLRYGDPQEALRIQRLGDYGGPHRDDFLQARIDPSPANIEKAISRPRAWTRHTPEGVGELAQVLGEFGREEELFQILLNWPQKHDVKAIIDVLFRPALHEFRRDPRMIAVAKRMRLLDYWQKSGAWPDFCRDSDLPYDCKAEASKLPA